MSQPAPLISSEHRVHAAIERPGLIHFVGRTAIEQVRRTLGLAGLVWVVVWAAMTPSNWRRTVRRALARQILFSGVEAIGIVVFLSLSLGVLVAVQYQVWVGRLVQSQWLGMVVVVVIVRELGPLLVNIAVIARSGNTIASELGLMHVTGEIRVLESMGLEPLFYLVVPRVLGLIISVACLTVLLIAMASWGVYACGQWIGLKTGMLSDFYVGFLMELRPADMLGLLMKITIAPVLAGCICCAEGLRAGDMVWQVPRAARIAVQRSIVALFLVNAIISVLTYL